MQWGSTGLGADQVAFVERTVPGARVVSDDSWGLLDTQVLHVVGDHHDVTVKASGTENTHFPRELLAHREWTAPLVATGDVGTLLAADEDLRVLVLERVPGHLALGTPDEHDPDVHRQAGTLLRRLHDQHMVRDDGYLRAETEKALASLTAPHRIPAEVVERATDLLRSCEPTSTTLVPAHGDWQPRNWIVDEGRLRLIDFGRFAFRPRSTDLTRLAVQHWRTAPELERAFFAGYGDDPRDPDDWRWLQLREAIGTVVWSFAVGTEPFEEQGRRMLADALAAFDEPSPCAR